MPYRGAQAVEIATVFSQFIQALGTLIYFFKKSLLVRFHGVKLAKDLLPEIFSVGMSAMFMQIMMLIQMTVVYNTAVHFEGIHQIDLMGVARVMQLAFVPIWDMSQGVHAVGINFRSKKIYTRSKAYEYIYCGFCLSGQFFLCYIIDFFSVQILSAFITDFSIVKLGLSNF